MWLVWVVAVMVTTHFFCLPFVSYTSIIPPLFLSSRTIHPVFPYNSSCLPARFLSSRTSTLFFRTLFLSCRTSSPVIPYLLRDLLRIMGCSQILFSPRQGSANGLVAPKTKICLASVSVLFGKLSVLSCRTSSPVIPYLLRDLLRRPKKEIPLINVNNIATFVFVV